MILRRKSPIDGRLSHTRQRSDKVGRECRIVLSARVSGLYDPNIRSRVCFVIIQQGRQPNAELVFTMQSSSSSWVGYGKLAVNVRSSPKMAIVETDPNVADFYFSFHLFVLFYFLLRSLVSDRTVYSTRLVLAKNLVWPAYDTARPV